MDTTERVAKVLSPEFRDKFTELYMKDDNFREEMDAMHRAYTDGLRDSLGLDSTWHYRSGYTDLDSFKKLELLLGTDMRMVVCSVRGDIETLHYTVFISNDGLDTLKKFQAGIEEDRKNVL